jgi:hypothetical protein
VTLTTERLDEITRKAAPSERFTLKGDEGDEFLDAARMGVAWAECEAALPEGWEMGCLDRQSGEWAAIADGWNPTTEEGHDYAAATGPTPTAALLALAAKLREGSDVSHSADE